MHFQLSPSFCPSDTFFFSFSNMPELLLLFLCRICWHNLSNALYVHFFQSLLFNALITLDKDLRALQHLSLYCMYKLLQNFAIIFFLNFSLPWANFLCKERKKPRKPQLHTMWGAHKVLFRNTREKHRKKEKERERQKE